MCRTNAALGPASTARKDEVNRLRKSEPQANGMLNAGQLFAGKFSEAPDEFDGRDRHQALSVEGTGLEELNIRYYFES